SEAWKYTTLQPLGGMSFAPPGSSRVPSETADIPDVIPRIIFAGGQYREDVSANVPGFARFADQPDFGELSWPDRDPMVALNTMLAEDGAVLSIPEAEDAGTIFL